ncbi:DUF982 domain-containing protein [Corticibacterium sp. UT-5YL-CI-8]|nr:DUF982 domain-containing protein [Tianweitania sp. UT-5YL-CI-8]
MERFDFASPVFVTIDHEAEEITSVTQAIEFLRRWPQGRRGPVYRCAVNCCQGAMDGSIDVEAARKGFVSFARISGVLNREMAMPMMVGGRGSLEPLIK